MMLYSMLHTIVSPITKGIYRIARDWYRIHSSNRKNDFVQQPQIVMESDFVGD